MDNTNIQLFEEQKIRTAWDEENEEWYYSVVDIVAVLAESKNPTAYWRKLKQRLKEEGNQTVTNYHGLKMTAFDGKKRMTDVATTEQVLRLIQSIPSPKAEPFKEWLAEVGRAIPKEEPIPKEQGKNMSKKPIKIAVFGREEDTKNYMRALGHLGVEATCTLSLEEASLCDGLLLPGGGDIDPARYNQPMAGSVGIDEPLDRLQFAACKMFAEENRPILGICKGSQVINVYFGGTLIQDMPNAAFHKNPHGPAIIHKTISKEGSFVHKLYGEEQRVNSVHHQANDKLGEGLRAVQWAEDGTIEAIEHVEKPIIALQWHPERMCFEMATDDGVDGSKVLSYFVDKLCK